MKKLVTCKEDSVRLFGCGAFGNNLRQWSTLEEIDDGFTYPIVIRYKHPVGGGGPSIYHLTKQQIPFALVQLECAGWNLNYIYFNEGAPDHHATLQGELCQMDDGSFILFYNNVPMHMNDALKHEGAREVRGRLAILDLLRRNMTDSSYADLEALIETFPMHAIEFTCFKHYLGQLRGRNTIFWDARFH